MLKLSSKKYVSGFFQKRDFGFISVDERRNITQDAFSQNYFSQKPVVITHGVSWPAFSKWQSNNFLDKYASAVTENLFEFDLQKDYDRKKVANIDLSTAIAKMKNNSDHNRKYYIIRQSIANTLPDLLEDVHFPTWHTHPEQDKYDVNLWMGEKGNKTPIHYDAIQNFLVQVAGIKEIFLFKPNNNFIPKMTPFSPGSGRFNFSTVPHIDGQQSKAFLRMIEHPEYQVHRLMLEPGMVLYIPPGWWHQVNTCSFSISVNYFWMEALQNYNSCRSSILDFQATSLYRKTPPDVSKLVNNCTYVNCLETIESLIASNQNLLATRLCGTFIEGIFEEIGNIFFENSPQPFVSNPQENIMLYINYLENIVVLPRSEIDLWTKACFSCETNAACLNSSDLKKLLTSIKNCFHMILIEIKNKNNSFCISQRPKM